MNRAQSGERNAAWQPLKKGQRFGSFVLRSYVGTNRRGQVWIARCACGNEAPYTIADLRLRVKTKGTAQCRQCGVKQRIRNGGARRSGLMAAVAQRGAKDALYRMNAVDIDAELPSDRS